MTGADNEYHLIPVDRKEHVRTSECWCKPTLMEAPGPTTWIHDVFKPVIEECKSVDEVVEFFDRISGEKCHKEMLQAMLGSAIRVIVARGDGNKIIALAAYAMIFNPFIGKTGYSLLVDMSDNYQLEIPDAA
jgi:hypothetical protein